MVASWNLYQRVMVMMKVRVIEIRVSVVLSFFVLSTRVSLICLCIHRFIRIKPYIILKELRRVKVFCPWINNSFRTTIRNVQWWDQVIKACGPFTIYEYHGYDIEPIYWSQSWLLRMSPDLTDLRIYDLPQMLKTHIYPDEDNLRENGVSDLKSSVCQVRCSPMR